MAKEKKEKKVDRVEFRASISKDALACVEGLADSADISAGEAAERLITMGWSRRRALAKYAKAQKGAAKPAKRKAGKKKVKKAKSKANGAAHASASA